MFSIESSVGTEFKYVKSNEFFSEEIDAFLIEDKKKKPISNYNRIYKVWKIKFWIYRPSRNRTYIGNLEGFCPNPLDDRPLFFNMGNTGFEPVTFCL